jgi:hypothetical protein
MPAETVKLTRVRISFPSLAEPTGNKEFPNAPKRYSADFILEPTNPGMRDFMAQAWLAASEKWKEHTQQVFAMIQRDRRMRCFGSGEERVKQKTMVPYAGYPGNVYLSAASDPERPPQIYDVHGKLIPNENTMERMQAARKIYGGCYVNAAIRPWIQDNQFGRAIRCNLIAVQFLADGEAFGEAQPDVSDMFDAVPGVPQEAQAPFGAPWMQQPPAPAPQAPQAPGMPSWMQPAPQAPAPTPGYTPGSQDFRPPWLQS